MSRSVNDVLKSGYLTPAEDLAMRFERTLEKHEETMGEGAAIAVTCEQFGLEYEDYAPTLIELPDGDWWLAEKLPVQQSKS